MIFVFGSNLSGIHGGGAARFAHIHKGAVMGVGEGLTGDCYALPTVGEGITRMQYADALPHIQKFLQFAKDHPDLEFQVTRVGCGLAGFTDAQIAPLFRDAPSNCLFDTAWSGWMPRARFWGTF